ncbi:Long chain acyl-CoA synthetase 7 peroxisomal [Globomyces sp. JEL0801]|nr:Long chain acyl-CoA synthetase 7 peroxisomal [Globomyces sp. JEL0801]
MDLGSILTILAVLAVLVALWINLTTAHPAKDKTYQYSIVDTSYQQPRKSKVPLKNPYPPGLTSLHQNFLHGLRTSKNDPFLGTRIKNGPYVWETYQDIYDRVKAFGSGLMKLGVKENENLGMYSINRTEWIVAEHASYMYNLVTVPLYDTLGAEALEYIITLTEMTTIVTTSDKIKGLLAIRKNIPNLKNIIVMGETGENLITAIRDQKLQYFSFSEVESLGKSHPLPANPTTVDSIATFCFTSGTTGLPKGAMITHGNMLSFIAGVIALKDRDAFPEVSKNDVHISFLPLAHVLERCVQAMVTFFGGQIGFYQGDTLKLLEDVAELKPTFFVAVPRLYSRIYDKVWEGVRAKGGVTEWLFNTAYEIKKKNLKNGVVTHSLLDKLVFKKVSARLGGRVRFMLTGAAPISPDVLDFLRICFSAYVLEAYGQTENTGGATVTDLRDFTTGTVGVPMPQGSIKLRDIPEMGYTSQDKPFPRGEVCTRGPHIFKGYYKQQDKTNETIVDGWCHTGDVGMWDSQGRLRIIDRVKNIFKLAQGEYIAPDKIESIYSKHPVIAQSFVYGDSLQPTLVAIIVPDPIALDAWLVSNGFKKYSTLENLNITEIRQTFTKELSKFGKENGLNGFEVIRNVMFDMTPFSPENGLLTPTFKSKRHELKQYYQAQITKMYSE